MEGNGYIIAQFLLRETSRLLSTGEEKHLRGNDKPKRTEDGYDWEDSGGFVDNELGKFRLASNRVQHEDNAKLKKLTLYSNLVHSACTSTISSKSNVHVTKQHL